MSDWSDIGAQLRATRDGIGWSLQDVAHRTRIPVQTLHELEENNYSSFPSPAYAKSFLAQYSEHLGIDANEWLDVFETGNVLSNLDSYDYLKEHEEVFGGEEEKPKRKAKKEAARSSSAHSLQPLVVFLVTASLVTGAVFGVLHLNKKLAEASNESAEETVAEEDTLAPLSSFPDSRPALPKRKAVPPAGFEASLVMATEQPVKLGTENLDAPGPDTTDTPAPDVITATPPRAVIVEE